MNNYKALGLALWGESPYEWSTVTTVRHKVCHPRRGTRCLGERRTSAERRSGAVQAETAKPQQGITPYRNLALDLFLKEV